MGSEKKRKRTSTDGPTEGTPSSLEKSERKKLKKLKNESMDNGDGTLAGQVAEQTTELVPLISPIATPMAGRKLTKKLFKLVGHAAKEKALRRGVKEVVLALRKSDSGIVLLAGNVFPVDVIAHLPVLCEEANVPYCYVSSKLDLGNAGLTKRPTSAVFISEGRAKGKDDLKAEISAIQKEVEGIQNLY